MEPKTLAGHFSEIEDPQPAGYAYRHDLVEILVISVCAMFSEVEGFAEIAGWARLKDPWLRRFLKLNNGTSSDDRFGRVFRLLDPKAGFADKTVAELFQSAPPVAGGRCLSASGAASQSRRRFNPRPPLPGGNAGGGGSPVGCDDGVSIRAPSCLNAMHPAG